MNKKTIITAWLALATLAGHGQAFTWSVEGTVEHAAPADTLLIIDAEEQKEIATLQVKDGHIIPASGTLEKPAVCCIATRGRQGWIGEFVLEGGTVTIHCDLAKPLLIHIGGTPLNDELMAGLSVLNTVADEDTRTKQMHEVVSRIVDSHPAHPISPFLIGQCQQLFKPSESLRLMEKLTPELQSSLKMDRLREYLLLAQETEVGKMFKELTGVSPDGRPVALSDYVGRGNYVLADFWASWCGPCKADMPEVIALYEKYKDKRLSVIGITVSDKPEQSDSIVRQMGIPFPQIYKSTPMSTYGVTAIPHKILFAPDGTILARGRISGLKVDSVFE